MSTVCLSSAKRIASFSIMHKLRDRNPQRLSRGLKARGQSQGHKKKKSEAKDSPSKDRSYRGQGQECSRPRTKAQMFCQKKEKVFKNFFQAFSKNKKGLQKKFLGDLQKGPQNNFSGDLQTFNKSKTSAVFEPKTGQFSRT